MNNTPSMRILPAGDGEVREADEPPLRWRERARQLRADGHTDRALASLRRGLTRHAAHPGLLADMAYLLLAEGKLLEAQGCAERALRRDPKEVDAQRARALALELQGQDEYALQALERIATLHPDYRDVRNDCGRVLMRVGRFADAVPHYDHVLLLKPDDPVARYNRCMALLCSGAWLQGFQEYEARWEILPPEARRMLEAAPVWDGRVPVMGKTVLLHHEQGYGDTLQFARYAAVLAGQGAKVILTVPPALKSLMSTLPGRPTLLTEGDSLPPFDLFCPLMSVLRALQTTPDSIPASTPYLAADPQRVQYWSNRLGDSLRVGLTWCGRREAPTNPARDIDPQLLKPLLNLPVCFVTLQKELSDADRALLERYPQIQRFGEELTDFADTAALIESLDLTISVDSAVAHLAGALNRPVWLLNRRASCWRWLQTGRTTSWYPSMRIFRQRTYGNWAEVIGDVEIALLQELEARQQREHTSTAAQQFERARRHHAAQQYPRALAGYLTLLERMPQDAALLQLSGTAYAQCGRWASAIEFLEAAIVQTPADAAAHSNLGNAYRGAGDVTRALGCYRKALELDPNLADGHYNLGLLLDAGGEREAALDSLERAMQINPRWVAAWTAHGNVLLGQGRLSEAQLSYTEGLAVDPEDVSALINRSVVAQRRHAYEEAIVDAEKAFALAPASTEALCTLGAAHAGIGEYGRAFECYERALSIDPNHPSTRWNKGLARLLHGRLREGFELYEARWSVKELGLERRFGPTTCLRSGAPLAGKVLFIHAEQGYGDTLQFCRYASVLATQGARVVLEVPGSLVGLVSSLPRIERVIPQGTGFTDFDAQCPLLSLPHVLGTDEKSIPASVPYLRARTSHAHRWQVRLDPRSLPRVGVAWSGKPTHRNDARRSIPFEALEGLWTLPAQFISLQKEMRAEDACAASHVGSLLSVREDLADFDETAGLMAQLDLVITIDTAVAHLAGALGKPVWILLSTVPDWRWQLRREDSPWYPSARLFRRMPEESWRRLIGRVTTALAKYLRNFDGSSPADPGL